VAQVTLVWHRTGHNADMLFNLPLTRSVGARILFFGTALITAAIALWANGGLDARGAAGGLTPIFLYLFTIYDYAGANCALLILISAALVSARFSFRTLLRWIGEHPVKVASLTTVVLCAGVLLVYRNHPLSMDEYSPLFQSKIFASGHLTGEFPTPLLDWLIPPPFQNFFLNVSHATGRVTSSYWPSFALLLTPFTALGIPWACNPVISGLTLLAAHRLALRIFNDVETAGLTVLLTIASPVFFADGISYYSMSAHLLANTVYALLLTQPTPRRAFTAGLVGSVALTLHNPVPHMLFAVPWLLWMARQPDAGRRIGALLAGYLPLVLLLGFGWFLFSSQLIHQGMAVSAGAASADSFGVMGGAFRPPTVSLLLARAMGIAKIWVWAVPGLLVLACVGGWRWRRHPVCRLLIASALVTLFGYIIIPFDQGHGWGYRYFHSAWIVLAILGAGALAPAGAPEQDEAGKTGLHRDPVFADAGTRSFVVACALLTLTAGVGLRAVQIHEFVSRLMSQEPAYTGSDERRVVIIDPSSSYYGQDLIRNDPWLRGNVIRMITHGRAADTDMMRARFPELHRVYYDRFGSVWSAAPARVAGAAP
jgi:hypothetical protein